MVDVTAVAASTAAAATMAAAVGDASSSDGNGDSVTVAGAAVTAAAVMGCKEACLVLTSFRPRLVGRRSGLHRLTAK